MREVLLIGNDGEPLGVITTEEAMRMAKNVGLDLVEVNPNARPPVAKIMDYGKFKYRQKKKASGQKTHQAKLKEVRLHPDTGEHDLVVRLKQASKFLEHGDKVLITVHFKGRELAHREFGSRMLERFQIELSMEAKVEKAPSMEGKRMSLLLAPLPGDVKKRLQKAAEEAKEAAISGKTDSGRMRRVITLDEAKKIATGAAPAEAPAPVAAPAAAPAKAVTGGSAAKVAAAKAAAAEKASIPVGAAKK